MSSEIVGTILIVRLTQSTTVTVNLWPLLTRKRVLHPRVVFCKTPVIIVSLCVCVCILCVFMHVHCSIAEGVFKLPFHPVWDTLGIVSFCFCLFFFFYIFQASWLQASRNPAVSASRVHRGALRFQAHSHVALCVFQESKLRFKLCIVSSFTNKSCCEPLYGFSITC